MNSITQPVDRIIVQAHTIASTEATLTVAQNPFTCALGRSGISPVKREGDGITPAGCWPLRRLLYRADRLEKPETHLPSDMIAREQGWCDDPASPDYNRLVRLPIAASHEHMWRDDHVYDLVVVLGFNDDPVVPGAGSAIFFHLAHQDFRPTEGCVAVALPAMLEILKHCGPDTIMQINNPAAA